jgi:PAS domain S-box-containing protein
MFGYTKEEVIGKHPGEVSPALQPDGQDSVSKAETLNRNLKDGSSQLFEWVHQRKDGSEFTAEVKLHQISIQDETLSLAVLRDVTERKNAEAAAQEERQRLAHELHDAVSQTLFSASTIAQTLERTWDDNPDLVYQNLGELQILTQGALAEMRNLLLELRPGALEHIPMPDLLRQLVEGFSGRTKTKIELYISGDHPLSFDVRFVFFRLAQEALNNIIKHARANQVRVNYDSLPDQVQLIVEDDGRGFDPTMISPGHHGLEIMKERAATINAKIHIKSQDGGGTIVSIIWQPREVPR